jgi:hypothetical protein
MRTTVSIDDDLLEVARQMAEAREETLGQVLSRLIRRGLEPRVATPGDGGLPTFSVEPDAPVIPGQRAVELIAEEGCD